MSAAAIESLLLAATYEAGYQRDCAFMESIDLESLTKDEWLENVDLAVIFDPADD